MTENFRFTSEDTPEKIRLNQTVEGLGLRNIRVRDEDDNQGSEGYGEVFVKKVQRTSPSPSRGHRDDRRDVEPDDVDFGLDFLTNPQNTFTEEQLVEQTKPVYTTDGKVEPVNSYLPDLDTILKNAKGKSGDDLKSSRSDSSRRTTSTRVSSRLSTPPRSTGGKSAGWRKGDFRTTKEAEYDRKATILHAFAKLERRGIPMARRFTMASDLDEMEKEYYRVKKEVDVENAVMFMRESFLNVLNILEYVNDKYDPFDFYITGFTDHTYQSISRYDNVFEELYEKYHNRVNAPPEVRFLLMVGSSAVFYHMGHKMTEDENLMRKLRSNPEAMRKLREMAGEGEGDAGEQNKEFNKRKAEYQGQQAADGGAGPAPQQDGGAAPVEARDGFGREFITPEVNRGGAVPGQKRPAPAAADGGGSQRKMRGPQGGNVEDIMKRMQEREAAAAKEAAGGGNSSSTDSDSDRSETRTVRVAGNDASRRGRKPAAGRRVMKV